MSSRNDHEGQSSVILSLLLTYLKRFVVLDRYMCMEIAPGYPDEPVEESRGIDVRSTADGVEDGQSGRKLREGGRPWIGVHFECCGVYVRVYRERGADRYESRCPRCATPITVRVSPDGVTTSFIRARVT